MRIFNSVLIVITLCCLSSGQTKVQNSISVTDSLGAAITNAEVMFHWDPSGSTVGLKDNVGLREDLVFKTDKTGNVSAELPPGFYDVFISAPAFTPIALKIRLKKAPEKTLVKLRADPLVARELGDKFSQ